MLGDSLCPIASSQNSFTPIHSPLIPSQRRRKANEAQMPERRGKVRELRMKMDKYRALAHMVTDETTQRRIMELTAELEQQARYIEQTIDD